MNDICARELSYPRKYATETRGAALARFLATVDLTANPADCWPWLGTRLLNPGGEYGRFYFNGDEVRAHIFIYEFVNGTLDAGLVVRHICDNPPCVNPAHLLSGTHLDNVMDKFERERGANRKGERHPLARLTDEKVRRIRVLAKSGIRYRDIAESYGMSRQQIEKIVNRRNWGHVE
jgi:hypothetical protein